MEDLRDLALFVEVARTQSFKEASERLQLPLSSVSRRIAELEKRLGVQLLHRSTRQVTLTSVGQDLLERTQAGVDALRDTLHEIAAGQSGGQTLLRIALPVDFGTAVLLPTFAAFGLLHPGLRFDFTLSSERSNLIADQFDLAVRFGTLDDSQLVARRIATVRRGFYASPAFLGTRPEPREPTDLSALPTLLLAQQARSGYWVLKRGEQEIKVPVYPAMTANTVGALRRLAVLDFGVAALDHAYVEGDVAAERLRPVLPEWSLEPLPLYALTTGRRHSPLMKDLVAYLATNLVHC